MSNCDECGQDFDTHPSIDVRHKDFIHLCQPRAMKWKRVQPGHVIPEGQPYRVEHEDGTAYEGFAGQGLLVGDPEQTKASMFVDSTWVSPVQLPTAAGSVVRASLSDQSAVSNLYTLNYGGYWLSLNALDKGKSYGDFELTVVEILFDAGAPK